MKLERMIAVKTHNDQILLLELCSFHTSLFWGPLVRSQRLSAHVFDCLRTRKKNLLVSHLLTMLRINYLLEAMDRRWD
jgi:hypothetical protein